jgi:hypothetical protein
MCSCISFHLHVIVCLDCCTKAQISHSSIKRSKHNSKPQTRLAIRVNGIRELFSMLGKTQIDRALERYWVPMRKENWAELVLKSTQSEQTIASTGLSWFCSEPCQVKSDWNNF